MATSAHYHPRGIDIDTADDASLPKWLFDEIVSLHGHIDRTDPPVFTCRGNGEPMYVWQHRNGRYFLRHYKDGNPGGHSHSISGMSDEHRRQADYVQRAATDHGFSAELEKSTGNGTIIDVAEYGPTNVGFEIQRSKLSRAKAKRRAYLSYQAGWPTAWISDQEKDPDWAEHNPTGRLTVRGWDELPPPNTVHVIIGQFHPERDRTKTTGWRYARTPRQVLLDDLVYLMSAGDIIPVAVGKEGRVVLAYQDAREIIDSCTYPGASLWRPQLTTPRHKETAQSVRRACHTPPPAVPTPVQPVAIPRPTISAPPRLSRSEARCPCGQSLHQPQSIEVGRCEYCRLRQSKFAPLRGTDRCPLCAFHIPTQGHREGCPHTKGSR